MADFKQPKVAVIGLGAQGLVAVKNLLEEGFDVIGFDRNDHVGGIWRFSKENRLSALPTTVVNVSRERAAYTDFPFQRGTQSYPDAAQLDKYYNDYADHFNLRAHCRMSTSVISLQHDENSDTWTINVKSLTSGNEESLKFDKLVIATGPHNKPIQPELVGKDLFAGTISHSISFKDPSKYIGKRVLVVGASNTAADTCTSLAGVASKVYFSHRHTSLVLPRFLKNGTSLDHNINFRQGIINDVLNNYAPRASQKFMDYIITQISTSQYGALDPQWNISPAPSIIHQVPTVSDTLIPHLRAGTITSCAAPAKITGPSTILLQDKTTVEADAIIFCTGYSLDLSLLGPDDPTLLPNGTHNQITPRLYQNILSLKHPASLAFVGLALVFAPAALQADLSTMALAQLWSKKPTSPPLPSQSEMEAWYQSHLQWVSSVRALSPHNKIVKLSVAGGPWFHWVNETAGTGVYENLSYASWQAWRFWASDFRFCNLVMGGLWTPHVYRLFESTRRKKWDGARNEIVRVNEEVREGLARRRKAKVMDESR